VLVQRLVIDGRYLYVCGGPGMVREMKEAMAVVLGEKNWKKLVEEGRFGEEIF
jgi:sulfite reductase alpha subunit-like flavoprotein